MKQKIIVLKVITACWLLTSNSANAEINNKDSYGAYFSYSISSIEDPDGDVASSNEVSRGGIVLNYQFNRTTAIDAELFYHSDSYKASTNEIGQKVKGYGLKALYQWNFIWSWKFSPWFGIGASLNSMEYTDRHLINEVGFLSKNYDDREEINLGALVSAKLITKFDSFNLFYRLEYEFPIDKGIQGAFFSLGVLF